jgi:hypothetical protein
LREKWGARAGAHALHYEQQIDSRARALRQQERVSDFHNNTYLPSFQSFAQNPTAQQATDMHHKIDINVQSGVLTPRQGQHYHDLFQRQFESVYTGDKYAPSALETPSAPATPNAAPAEAPTLAPVEAPAGPLPGQQVENEIPQVMWQPPAAESE